MQIDLNCDMGESFGTYTIGNDELVMPWITSANIACGFHGGDPMVMEHTVALAKKHRVAVGAHPGFPDLLGFGRRRLETFSGEIRSYMVYQMGALAAFAKAHGIRLQHVKPHGALYNLAAWDERTAREVVAAIRGFDPELILVTLAGSLCAELAVAAGLRVAREAFPDRAYQSDGQLAPRSLPGAVIHGPEEIRTRLVKLVASGVLTSVEGHDVRIQADTLCLHGDTPEAWKLARVIHETLLAAGAEVMPMAMICSG
ncbi:MAG TPA: LamB/YcsF family protein [Syntrophobacteraceae bacterium]|nr:LamB/YcsF family protein [Syntrophobacteraceae bacterium]